MSRYLTNDDRLDILDDYFSGMNINQISKKRNRDYATVKNCLVRNGIDISLNSRFSQNYLIMPFTDVAYISIKGKERTYCMIDKEDVDRCKNFGIWSLTKAGYVANCKSGKYIHRFIMNASEGIEVDHINRNPLDNRKCNLRFATSSQQSFNQKVRRDNTSGHRGIYWDTERSKWHVKIQCQDSRFDKRFDLYEDAVAYADEIYRNLHGDFLNEETINPPSTTKHKGDKKI